jgi:hypothetical protein
MSLNRFVLILEGLNIQMHLWTIQRWEAWELLQRTGRWHANRAFIDTDFLSAYNWLVGQMRQRPC